MQLPRPQSPKTKVLNLKQINKKSNSHNNPPNSTNTASSSRRQILQSAITKTTKSLAATTTGIAFFATTSNKNIQSASAAQTPGEAIRRSAANLPGYGQADVFYPSSLLGKWKATRLVLVADGEISKYHLSSNDLPLTVSYDVRFISVDGDTNNNNDNGQSTGISSTTATSVSNGEKQKEIGYVIADRLFNEDSYYNALRETIEQKLLSKTNQTEEGVGEGTKNMPPFIREKSWSPSNPNVLTLNYSDGSSKEVKVTKRATELDQLNGLVSSSEFRRITVVGGTGTGDEGILGGGGGIPAIEASRILNKWKINENGNIEGIEIVYSEGSLGDPLMAANGNRQQQQIISKSRLLLVR
jgi:hypothetical protein